MIPVLKPEQIRKVDQLTVERHNISFVELMEKAGASSATWILEKFPLQKDFVVFCGCGNNGGDGLVIARLLAEQSRRITVYIAAAAGKRTEAFNFNLQRLQEQVKTEIIFVEDAAQVETVSDNAIIIESLLGNGINRPPEGELLKIIDRINSFQAKLISIDVPGGMLPDKVTNTKECIRADYTLCFEVPRLPFFFPETGNLCGEWVLLDIGLDPTSISEVAERIYLLESADLQHWMRPRDPFSYKNNFGHALLLGGSKGKCGAALLMAEACMRSGAGLVTVRVPSCCVTALQSRLPEAMVDSDDAMDQLEQPVYPIRHEVIGVGPGMGHDPQTGNVLKRLLQDFKGGLVLDADALNLLAENKTWLAFLPANTILTPHHGEFKRLVGEFADPFERLNAQREFSKRYHCILVLKGRYTFIACPDGSLLINPTGNPGMATAGSGDVLTGIITGLRAQGWSAMASAAGGVFLHGLAGDLAAEEKGAAGLLASDIVQKLPVGIKSLG